MPDLVQLRVRAAVHLAGELRRRVQVRGKRERALLVDDSVDRRVAVDPDGAAVDDAVDAGVAGRLEDHLRAVDVDPVGPQRVGDDVVDVRDRGEVDDRLAAARRAPRGVAVGDVADDRLDRRSAGGARDGT